ncbi:uncharacterized protein LOC120412628 isoform X3 [Culex pipiens pallens]|uniref:uncharacterized protein LOC120412628 isoform X3 n=1 Tax=Culex pipiens pallens TaxID=42434 RepID=UPI001953B667|nr:uncharacterized protein LOC120412628 isoform X3 [Culex pipiens pallens]
MAQVPARNPKYSAADLWPPGSKDRDFPPAAFFPVYVGNFLCQQRAELVARVQQYFASKGLLARMVFVRSAQNDPFQSYQDKTKLYDCLVYLTRQRDAQDAVKYLHRDKYYGHRLNVFPGRVPDFILVDQSVGYDLPDKMTHWPDHIIVQHIKVETLSNIRSIKRLNSSQVIVQYVNAYQREKALRRYQYFMPHSLDGQTIYNQHFLEQDVMGEIRHQIAHTPFMVMGPERHVLDALCSGQKPNLPSYYKGHKTPKLGYYSCRFGSHPPQVRLQIAQAVQQNFGLVCDFVAELTQVPDAELQREVQKFFRVAANGDKKCRKGFRLSLINSYGYRNGRLLFQMAPRK